MKKLVPLMLLFMFMLSNLACRKTLICVSCIAQKKTTGEIIDTRSACDEESSYTNGFATGFKSKYANQSDSINVLCK